MIKLSMDKVAYLTKELSKGKSSIQTYKYKELDTVLSNVQEMTVTYPFGMLKTRTNKLIKLGFQLKETIWFNDDAPYAEVKQIWAR